MKIKHEATAGKTYVTLIFFYCVDINMIFFFQSTAMWQGDMLV